MYAAVWSTHAAVVAPAVRKGRPSRAATAQPSSRAAAGSGLSARSLQPRPARCVRPRMPAVSGARRVAVTAVTSSSPPAPAASAADDGAQSFLFHVGANFSMQVVVTAGEVAMSTTLPTDGALLLHWGLQVDGVDGWVLPEPSTRPRGTQQYKDRALQTPWVKADGYQWLRVRLPPGGTSMGAPTHLQFVLKDAALGAWYEDAERASWSVPLPPPSSPMPPPPPPPPALQVDNLSASPQNTFAAAAAAKAKLDKELLNRANRAAQAAKAVASHAKALDNVVAAGKRDASIDVTPLTKKPPPAPKRATAAPAATPPAAAAASAPTRTAPAPARAPEPQRIDRELQNLWAFRMWEVAGRPDRDAASQQREFDVGCADLDTRVAAGWTVDALWAAAKTDPFPPAASPPSTSNGNAASAAAVAPPPAAQPKAPARASAQKPAAAAAPVAPPKPPKAAAPAVPVSIPKLPEDAPELCALKAYIMWEHAGKPDRDAAEEDREYRRGIDELNAELRAGLSLQEIEAKLRAPAGGSSSSAAAAAPAPASQLPLSPSQWLDGQYHRGHTPDPMSWACDAEAAADPSLADAAIVGRLLDAENNFSEWTLMHRANLCKDLLGEALALPGPNKEATLRALYVWMRYSAVRAITWQRNYNTQPRQLSGAQDGMSRAVAAAYGSASTPAERWYTKAILGCSGRGGDGQRIRDDILHIMHRHNIKEKKGTWMEEWHQKLHNNTTPDDIIICEAYLAFLRGGGNNGLYWEVIHAGGIDRARLESFARPVTLEPEDFPHCREHLIRDFEEYLGVLKSVHAGTDLGVAANAARGALPGGAAGALDVVLTQRNNPLAVLPAAVEVRGAIHQNANMDLLYLDLALEEVVRAAAEGAVADVPSLHVAAAVFAPLLENLCLSTPANHELCVCLRDWQRLPDGWWHSKGGALQAVAVVDRVRRALGELSDAMTAALQTTAETVGGALNEVEDWQVTLFSEEVVRGSAAFAVSLMCTRMDPLLRATAEMGSWMVISPGKHETVVGKLLVVEELSSIQEQVYAEPTVLLVNQVGGDEEIPDGVVACVTPQAPDVLSHVSVRARNCEVLFATCYDPSQLEALQAMAEQPVQVTRTAGGDVTFAAGKAGGGGVGAAQTAAAATTTTTTTSKAGAEKMQKPAWCGEYALGMDAFKQGVVGAKSNNLAALRGKLPPWINLPPSVAVPFSTFEAVLDAPQNRDVKASLMGHYELVKGGDVSALATCRQAIQSLTAPPQLQAALGAAAAAAGVPWPATDDAAHWAMAFAALRSVWASQYNERAYLSLRKAGLPHEQLCMAVLVQRVVPADYAFVIHTENPSTGNPDEIYIELVRGLGETLVGNYAGRALSAVVQKSNLTQPEVLSFPSKSVGLFVDETLIFRSDSNGEDLEGYAGAGLYDSIPMHMWREEPVSHFEDALLSDEEARRALLEQVARVGAEVEAALGAAQDIEGAVEMTADGPRITLVQTRPQM